MNDDIFGVCGNCGAFRYRAEPACSRREVGGPTRCQLRRAARGQVSPQAVGWLVARLVSVAPRDVTVELAHDGREWCWAVSLGAEGPGFLIYEPTLYTGWAVWLHHRQVSHHRDLWPALEAAKPAVMAWWHDALRALGVSGE